jgi:hypothetical protein
MITYNDLDIVQMRGQCNRVRLGLRTDDKKAMMNCVKEDLFYVDERLNWQLTERGNKFSMDLSGTLPD